MEKELKSLSSTVSIAQSELEKLKLLNPGLYSMVEYIMDNTSEDSKFLVFRQSDFAYYVRRNYIRHVDPQLKKFYLANDKNEAFQCLVDLGVDYIYLPNYYTPTIFNTPVFRIISDLRLTQRVFLRSGYSLYKILRKQRAIQRQQCYQFDRQSILSGKYNWTMASENFEISNDASDDFLLYTWNKDRGKRNFLGSGLGSYIFSPSHCFSNKTNYLIENNSTYHLSTRVKGSGYLIIYIAQYDSRGRLLGIKKIWESILKDCYHDTESIFQTSNDVQEYRILFRLESKGELYINDVKLDKMIFLKNGCLSNIDSDCMNEFHKKNKKEQTKTNPHNGTSLNWTKLSSGSLLPVPYNPKENNITQNKHTAYVKQAFERQSNFLSRIIPIMATKTKTIDTWLYSGSGRIETSPSCSFDYSTLAPFNNDAISEYRLAFLLRGSNNLTPAECYIDDVYFAYTLPAESDSLNTNKRRQLIRWDFKTDDPVTRWTASENTVNKLAIIDNEQGFLKYSAPSLSFLLSDFKTILGLGKKKNENVIYSGTGKLNVAPSRNGNSELKLTPRSKIECKISALVKGKGILEPYFWWYSDAGVAKKKWLGEYYLPSEYNLLVNDFIIPVETTEYNIHLRLKGQSQVSPFLWWYDGNGKGHQIGLADPIQVADEFQDIHFCGELPPEAVEFRLALEMSGGFFAKKELIVDDVSISLEPSKIITSDKDTRNWTSIYATGFEASDPISPPGWGTYSEGRSIDWPWGLSKESFSGENSLYLKQQDSGGYWLHSGEGLLTQPPSRSLDTAYKVVNKGEGEYKLTGKTKGVGRLDLYIWWYTKAGKATSEYVGRYFLPSDYKYFEQIFTLPPEAVEYRVAFLLRGQRGSESAVFLDDITIERPEEQLVKQSTDTRNWTSIYETGFEASDSISPPGWGTYSEGRSVDWPWGLSKESFSGELFGRK
nr:hypothetical protein [uncultured Desulfobacter sp.]